MLLSVTVGRHHLLLSAVVSLLGKSTSHALHNLSFLIRLPS